MILYARRAESRIRGSRLALAVNLCGVMPAFALQAAAYAADELLMQGDGGRLAV